MFGNRAHFAGGFRHTATVLSHFKYQFAHPTDYFAECTDGAADFVIDATRHRDREIVTCCDPLGGGLGVIQWVPNRLHYPSGHGDTDHNG